MNAGDKLSTSPLGRYIRRIMDQKRLTYREVSQRAGGAISHSAVSALVKKPQRRPSYEMLKALAAGLGEPENDIIEAVRGEGEEEGPDAEELRKIESKIAELKSWLEYASPDDLDYIYKSIEDLIERIQKHHRESDYVSKPKAPPVRIVPKKKRA